MWRRVGCASLGENQNTQVEKRYLERQALGRADAHRAMGVPRRSRRILSSRWRWRGRFRAGRGSRFGKWKREIESGGTKVPRLRRSRPFVHWYPALARWANF